MKKLRVVLYGKSVILGSVGASLRRFPDLEIIELSPPYPPQEELKTMLPDVILFDSEAARPDHAFTLLETNPAMLLIGVSPDSNQVRLWTGQQLSELSMQDLVQIIRRDENESEWKGDRK
jgi:hypothetical protein